MSAAFRRSTLVWLALVIAALAVASVVGAVSVGLSGPASRTISAQFAEAPGLYAGNDVDVLGIPVGRVTAIKAGPRYVTVTMQVKKSVRLPADASAVLMAPEVVSDRFVQLGPAYTSGPTMAGGAVIPLSRTAIPQSVDAVVYQLNRLATELGPTGANRNGALSALVHQLAVSFGPNGQDFHNAVVNFNQALTGLSANSPALAGTLTNLGQLSQALAGTSGAYQSLSANLDSVSQTLANDRQDVSAVMASLQTLFADLTSFINQDGTNLGASLGQLTQFAGALSSEQTALAHAYDLAPLSVENLDNAINKSAPGGAAIVGRYDAVGSTTGLFNQVCGSSALRFLVILATGTQTNPLTRSDSTDTLCAIGNALNALTPPPGSSPGPDLSLEALAG